MKDLLFVPLFCVVLITAGCSTMEGIADDLGSLNFPSLSMDENSPDQLVYQGACPSVEVVDDLKAISDLSNPGILDDSNLISRAEITRIDTACSYSENAVSIDVQTAFTGVLGPQTSLGANDISYSYPFFVAIAAPNGELLAKEVFTVNMTYPSGQATQTALEKMRQVIPVRSQDNGAKHKIMIGFQLSPDQLAYNRERQQRAMILQSSQEIKPSITQMPSSNEKPMMKDVQTAPTPINAPVDIIRQ